jgi:integrase
MNTHPAVETERLLLRQFIPDDYENLSALLSDPEVTRYLSPGRPATKEEMDHIFPSVRRHWDRHGFGRWAVARKDTGEFIGYAGLRLTECCTLRVKDIYFAYCQITVRDGKGGKDRVTVLPSSVSGPLLDHLTRVKSLHERDLARGYGRARCRTRCGASTRTRPGSGAGSSSSLLRSEDLTARPGRSTASIPPRVNYSEPSSGRSRRRDSIASSRSRCRATPPPSG